MPIDDVDDRVSIVLDLKTPASGECDRNLLANVPLLRPKDQVKFVICDRGDYEWSKAQVHMHDLGSRVDDILFSPSYEELAPALLAQWVLEDRLKVRMQLQLHKQIWGDKKGV
jgi:7-carboxy-7-deazaguanine synthase